MGIDKSLSDDYPSVVINGRKYHYGQEPAYGQYLVENASIAKDYWCFDEKQDLQAFLVNLPESADHRSRIRAAYPDWEQVSDEQRTAYLAEDRAAQRAIAAEKLKSGTAQSFDMDLEGKQGPHEPQHIRKADGPAPLERVERELRGFDAFRDEGLSEAGRLRMIEGEIDWTGVSAADKEVILAREIDFKRITPEQFTFVYADIAFEKIEPADPTVAQALFDRARGGGESPRIRDTTKNLIEAIWLDVWPRAGAVVDFGLSSQEHYEAIYYGVREGEITPEALDAALGKGDKLTALARSAASNPHRDIVFSTSWDGLVTRPEGPESGEDLGDDPVPRGKQAEALYAEWREDYAARARESAVQPYPSPSEIAERNRGKPAEPDRVQDRDKDRGRD